MKNFHWGHAILLFFIIYLAVLFGTVIKSTTIDRELVRDDYYALDLNYQERYDRIENRKTLQNDLLIRYNLEESCLYFDFGSSVPQISASVRMYRVAGKKAEDVTFSINLEDKRAVCMEIGKVLPGKWVTEVSWEDQNSSYFKEERILINKS
jgi:hypothetical protein